MKKVLMNRRRALQTVEQPTPCVTGTFPLAGTGTMTECWITVPPSVAVAVSTQPGLMVRHFDFIGLIDWIVFYAVSAIFQPYNGG